MMVSKRDGSKEPVSLDKITNRVSVLATGLTIDPIVVAQKAIPGLYNGITTTEIDNYLAETSAALTVEHPDYSNLAARIKANSLHKITPGFIIASKLLYEDGLLNDKYYQKIINNAETIESIIDYDLDYNFDYFALTTLTRAYLLKYEGKVIERPQDLWMRVALTVAEEEFNYEKIKYTYSALSKGYYTHATPTSVGLRLLEWRTTSDTQPRLCRFLRSLSDCDRIYECTCRNARNACRRYPVGSEGSGYSTCKA